MKTFISMICVFLVSCSNSVNFDLPQTSQNFAQDIKYNNKVDFLFIVDNTSSMGVVQKYLADQLPFLIDSFSELRMDFHIGVVTTTMNSHFDYSGKLFGNPKFIDSSSKNINEELAKKILVGLDGATIEQGLDAMVSVFSDVYLNGEGKNFLRKDAYLSVIALSNEDDESHFEWTYYADFLNKLKPNYEDGSKAWSFNFFGVLSLNDQCPSGEWSFYKSPGIKFLELVKYSSGFSGSICGSNIYTALSGIKSRVIQVLTDYKLKEVPEVSSIKVYLNNQLIDQDEKNGWTYIKEFNLIRFNGTAIPKSDDGIRVDFKPLESN